MGVGKKEGLHCKTLFHSLHRPTTHCIKRPRPPSPTSPTGALNDEQAPADHCQTVPGPWVSLQSCLQGRIPVGRAGGWEWGGLEECQYVGRCARVCVCACVCCVVGNVSQISRVPQPLSSTCLLQGSFLLNPRVACVAEQVFFSASVGSWPSFSGHPPWSEGEGP